MAHVKKLVTISITYMIYKRPCRFNRCKINNSQNSETHNKATRTRRCCCFCANRSAQLWLSEHSIKLGNRNSWKEVPGTTIGLRD